MASKSAMWVGAANAVGSDFRGMAFVRMCLGALMFSDSVSRLPYLTAFHSSLGLMPLDRYTADGFDLSIHRASYDPRFHLILTLVASVMAVFLFFGWHTRHAIVAVWLLFISACHHNWEILQGGDMLMSILLFWAMFLPLSECWSVDSMFRYMDFDAAHSASRARVEVEAPARKEEGASGSTKAAGGGKSRFISAATIGWTSTVCTLYWCNAIHKYDSVWRTEGSAVWYALALDQLCTHMGRMMFMFPSVMWALTHATFYFEAGGPVLTLLPFWQTKVFICAVGIKFHFGLFMTMELGPFPWVCFTMWFALMPKQFWDWAVPKRYQPDFSVRDAYVAALPGAGKSAAVLLDDIVSTATGQSPYDREGGVDAVAVRQRRARAVLQSPLWGRLFRHMRMVFLLVACYASTFWPFREAFQEVGTNLQWPHPGGDRANLNWLVRGAGLAAKWNMFAPFPTPASGWFYFPGELIDGSEVNLFAMGGPVDREAILKMGAAGRMPDDPFRRPSENYCVRPFASERWRKYMDNVRSGSRDDIHLLYARYICRMWNHMDRNPLPIGTTHHWNNTRDLAFVQHRDPQGLKSFKMLFYRQTRNYTAYMAGEKQPTDEVMMWEHQCWLPEELQPPSPPPAPVGAEKGGSATKAKRKAKRGDIGTSADKPADETSESAGGGEL